MSTETSGKEKEFSILTGIGIGFILLYLLTGVFTLLLVACIVCWISLIPAIRRPIVKVWMRFTQALGAFNSKIILSLVWFLFLTPIAFLYRLSGKDPMRYKQRNAESLFVKRNHIYEAEDLDNPW